MFNGIHTGNFREDHSLYGKVPRPRATRVSKRCKLYSSVRGPGYQRGVLICSSDPSAEAPIVDGYFVFQQKRNTEAAREIRIFESHLPWVRFGVPPGIALQPGRDFFDVLSGSIPRTQKVSHMLIKQKYRVSTLRVCGTDNDGYDRAGQTEIVLKILKPSRAVLMTAPGI